MDGVIVPEEIMNETTIGRGDYAICISVVLKGYTTVQKLGVGNIYVFDRSFLCLHFFFYCI